MTSIEDNSGSNPINVNEHDTSKDNTDEVIPSSEAKTSKKRPCKTTSDVWEHFSKEKDNAGTVKRVKCNYCCSYYASSSATSTLRGHVSKCPKNPSHDKKQKSLAFNVAQPELISWRFDQEKSREAFARMIVMDELPFSFIERPGFRQFMFVAQPKFMPISRRGLVRDLIKLHESEKKKLKSIVANSKFGICLTTYTWTSI